MMPNDKKRIATKLNRIFVFIKCLFLHLEVLTLKCTDREHLLCVIVVEEDTELPLSSGLMAIVLLSRKENGVEGLWFEADAEGLAEDLYLQWLRFCSLVGNNQRDAAVRIDEPEHVIVCRSFKEQTLGTRFYIMTEITLHLLEVVVA